MKTVLAYTFFFGLLSNAVLPSFFIGIWIHPSYLFALLLMVLYFSIESRKRLFLLPYWTLFPFILILMVVLSDFYGKAFKSAPGDFSKLNNQILLFFSFIPYFIFFENISKLNFEKTLKRAIAAAFFVFLSVTFIQVFGKGFSQEFIDLYATEKHVETASLGLRYTLTGSDPNVGSAIASFFIVTYFVYFINEKKLKYFTFFLLAVIALFFAQGRTVIIGLGLILPLYILFFHKMKFFYKMLILLLLSAIVFYLAEAVDLYYLYGGVEELFAGTNGSVNYRLEKVAYAYNNFKSSPILGYGGGLEIDGSVVEHMDSEYALLLQRNGLLGVVFILSTLIIFARRGYNNIQSSLGAMLFLLTGITVFIMLTNVFFFSEQTFGFVVIMCFLAKCFKEKPRNIYKHILII